MYHSSGRYSHNRIYPHTENTSSFTSIGYIHSGDRLSTDVIGRSVLSSIFASIPWLWLSVGLIGTFTPPGQAGRQALEAGRQASSARTESAGRRIVLASRMSGCHLDTKTLKNHPHTTGHPNFSVSIFLKML